MQILPIQLIWLFRGGFWIVFVVPKWFLCADVVNGNTMIVLSHCGVLSSNFYWRLCVYVICTICPSLQTSWLHWLWKFPWLCQGYWQWQYPGDNISGKRFDVELRRYLWWENGFENIGEGLIWEVGFPWERLWYDVFVPFDVLVV